MPAIRDRKVRVYEKAKATVEEQLVKAGWLTVLRWVRLLLSSLTVVLPPPASSTAAAVAWSPPSLRAMRTTVLASCAAASTAMARPIPDDAPVTTTTCRNFKRVPS